MVDERIKNEYSNRYALVVPNAGYYSSTTSDNAVNNKINLSRTPSNFRLVADPFRQAVGKVWTLRPAIEAGEEVAGTNNVRFLGKTDKFSIPIPYAGSFGSLEDMKYKDVSDLWNNVVFTKGMYPDSLNLKRSVTRIQMFFGAPDYSVYDQAASSLMAKTTFLAMITDIDRKNQDSAYTITFKGEDGLFEGDQVDYPIVFNLNTGLGGAPYNYASMLSFNQPASPKYSDISLMDVMMEPLTSNASKIAKHQSARENATSIMGAAIFKAGQQSRLRNYYSFFSDTYAFPSEDNTKKVDKNDTYLDYAFAMPLPMSPRALSLTNEVVNKTDIVVDINPQYNYYSKFYEKSNKDRNQLWASSDGQSYRIDPQDLPLIYQVPLDEDNTPSLDTDSEKSKFRFENFGHRIMNCGYERNWFHFARDQNIILDQNSPQFLDKYNNVKRQFPWYVDLRFNCDTNREFTTLFTETGMMYRLMSSIIGNLFRGTNNHVTFVGGGASPKPSKDDPILTKKYYDKHDESYDDTPENERASICKGGVYSLESHRSFYQLIPPASSEDKEAIGDDLVRVDSFGAYYRREYDLNNWLDHFIEYIAKGEEAMSADYIDPTVKSPYASYEKIRFFDEEDETINGYYNDANTPIEALKVLNFIDRYQSAVKLHQRSYADILDGTKAYTETLFYRIQKVYVGTDRFPGTPDIITQNIWLPKPVGFEEDQQIMKYIDTQIPYDQNWEYTIYAYQLVVGSRYGFQYTSTIAKNAVADVLADEFGKTSPNKVKAVKLDQSFRQTANEEGYNYSGGVSGGTERLESSNEDGVVDAPQNSRSYLWKRENGYPGRLIQMDAICEPEVRLVEVPIYKKIVRISDAPSIAPEIDIVPLNKEKNKIKINFLPSTVDREMEPISILEQDKFFFHYVRFAQNRDLLKSSKLSEILGDDHDLHPQPNVRYVEPKLAFKSDDYPVQYEIFRKTTAPEDYQSFRQSKKTILDAKEVSCYIDKLVHNNKYWYTFRSIDVHGNPSNPSPVYQVEMVENSGVVYPVISIYEFLPAKKGIKSKSFKRYLKIEAAHLQELLNLKESNLEDKDTAKNCNPKLGIQSQSVFNNKFKFRIRSKHTGKVLDLNVRFKTRHIEPVEEIISCGQEGSMAPSPHAEAGAGESQSSNENMKSAVENDTQTKLVIPFP